jgi:hypothetical protein
VAILLVGLLVLYPSLLEAQSPKPADDAVQVGGIGLSRAGMIRRYLIQIAVTVALWPCVAAAQSREAQSGGAQVGDRWVFDRTDELTGDPKDTYTRTVTEVSAKQITTHFIVSGSPGYTIMTFDQDWNLVDNSSVRFKPNNGQGIRLPLAVGKSWRAEYDYRNISTGAGFRGSVTNKVTAQESVTTQAGGFDAFKIETFARDYSPANPAKLWEYQIVRWYAPAINYWVRETFVERFDKSVRVSTSSELVDFSRKF